MCAASSPMVRPTTSRASTSAMITTVKIRRPISSLSNPLSARTLATKPRLDRDRMPARANALSNSRPSEKSSPSMSEVTTRHI